VKLQTDTLRRSLQIMGSRERLRRYLGGIPASWLHSWLSGYGTPPQAIFLRAVDLVLAQKLSRVRGATHEADCASQGIQIALDGSCARCPVCDHTRFDEIDGDHDPAGGPRLVCAVCALSIRRSDLVALSEAKAPAQRASDGEASRSTSSGVPA
jgi:hypothetical protein